MVKGHSMSLAMLPFGRMHMTSNSSLIETCNLYLVPMSINSKFYLSKFANFNLTHLNLVPLLGVTPFKFLGIRKLEFLGYRATLFA